MPSIQVMWPRNASRYFNYASRQILGGGDLRKLFDGRELRRRWLVRSPPTHF